MKVPMSDVSRVENGHIEPFSGSAITNLSDRNVYVVAITEDEDISSRCVDINALAVFAANSATDLTGSCQSLLPR